MDSLLLGTLCLKQNFTGTHSNRGCAHLEHWAGSPEVRSNRMHTYYRKETYLLALTIQVGKSNHGFLVHKVERVPGETPTLRSGQKTGWSLTSQRLGWSSQTRTCSASPQTSSHLSHPLEDADHFQSVSSQLSQSSLKTSSQTYPEVLSLVTANPANLTYHIWEISRNLQLQLWGAAGSELQASLSTACPSLDPEASACVKRHWGGDSFHPLSPFDVCADWLSVNSTQDRVF